jgi:hypothetical protein
MALGNYIGETPLITRLSYIGIDSCPPWSHGKMMLLFAGYFAGKAAHTIVSIGYTFIFFNHYFASSCFTGYILHINVRRLLAPKAISSVLGSLSVRILLLD